MTAAQFIDASGQRPFVWGKHDCCLWLADWGQALTGQDAAQAWRGRYRTGLGAMRRLGREGGLLAVVEQGALAVGMKPIATPYAGCVGVVTIPGGRQVGAIFTGRRWAMLKAGGGVLSVTADADAAWGR